MEPSRAEMVQRWGFQVGIDPQIGGLERWQFGRVRVKISEVMHQLDIEFASLHHFRIVGERRPGDLERRDSKLT